ncbi:MAG: ribonuclease III [Hyphomonadaceae bacterium]
MKPARPKRTRLRKAGEVKTPRLSNDALDALQTKLDHHFKSRQLLDNAMTHPSALTSGDNGRHSNQRLEFLGDRVLGLVIAERLYERRPSEREGGLAPRLNRLVNKSACAEAARRMRLGEYLILGQSERDSGGADKESILGDLCEAVIAALYLDGGLKVARRFIERAWAEQFANPKARVKDTKSLLQEWAQKHGFALPLYETLGRSGPDHAPSFEVRVAVGPDYTETGKGPSKQDAERAAATALYNRLETQSI